KNPVSIDTRILNKKRFRDANIGAKAALGSFRIEPAIPRKIRKRIRKNLRITSEQVNIRAVNRRKLQFCGKLSSYGNFAGQKRELVTAGNPIGRPNQNGTDERVGPFGRR